MNTRTMEYMKALEKWGNITKAAREVHISQSAFSQCLAKLEQELGTALFERREKKWTPTPAGKLYLKGAGEMLDIKNEAYRRISALAIKSSYTMSLAICSEVFILYSNQLFSALRSGFPSMHLNLFRADSKNALEQLRSGVADMAIYSSVPSKIKEDPGELLYQEELVMAVPFSGNGEPEKEAGRENIIDSNQLSASSLIIPVEDSHMGKLLYPLLRSYYVNLEDCYTADSYSGISLLFQNGYGSAFLPSRLLAREKTKSYKIYHADPPMRYDLRFMAGERLKKEKVAADMLCLIRKQIQSSEEN